MKYFIACAYHKLEPKSTISGIKNIWNTPGKFLKLTIWNRVFFTVATRIQRSNASKQGKKKPISWISRGCKTCSCNYSSDESECIKYLSSSCEEISLNFLFQSLSFAVDKDYPSPGEWRLLYALVRRRSDFLDFRRNNKRNSLEGLN